MIIEYVRYVLKTHRPDELVEAYRDAGEQLRAAPECLGYELAQCSDDPSSLVLRIQWESEAAHMEGFRRGRNFPAFLQKIRPFIEEIAEMRHYELSNVSWAR